MKIVVLAKACSSSEIYVFAESGEGTYMDKTVCVAPRIIQCVKNFIEQYDVNSVLVCGNSLFTKQIIKKLREEIADKNIVITDKE